VNQPPVILALPGDGSRQRYRVAAIATASAMLAACGIAALLWPEGRGLVAYALYAVPAHLLISVLANEPMLFAAARSYPPLSVAAAGTIGCLVAIVLDYALIGWLVNQRLVRHEIDDSRGFRRAQKFFGRAPFLLILGSALLPVPFYPVKILAIARDYPLSRFCLALLLGRLPRFYLLALGGQRVHAPNSAYASAAVALALIGGWGVWRTYRRNRNRASGEA
jgi:membrane protein YqaA with SNARE-associated domain